MQPGPVNGVMQERDSYYDRVQAYSPQRVAPFNAANRRLPSARERERALLVERLRLSPGMTVLDTGAGGGYLAEAIWPHVRPGGSVIGSDTAQHFVASIPDPLQRLVCGMDAFGLQDHSVDRVSNLAGLHHVQHKDDFFREAFRVLKPGGLVAVADVRAGTRPARWLNGPVDRMTDIGHDGMFVADGEFTGLMRDAGFVDTREQYERYSWSFPGRAEMVAYARDLFRLTRADLGRIESELWRVLKCSAGERDASLEWGLIYATGRKP